MADLPADRSKPKGSREQYNLVTDTVTGPNVRIRDNVIQAIAIGVFLLLGVLAGLLYRPGEPAAMVIGGLIGTVVGLIGSGAALGIYRLFRH